MDLCVIAALHRYCFAMPEAEYPSAIRSWPWDDEHMDRWVTAHKARTNETSAPAKPRGREAEARASATGSSGSASSASAVGSAALGSASSDLAHPGTAAAEMAAAPGCFFSKWGDVP